MDLLSKYTQIFRLIVMNMFFSSKNLENFNFSIGFTLCNYLRVSFIFQILPLYDLFKKFGRQEFLELSDEPQQKQKFITISCQK